MRAPLGLLLVVGCSAETICATRDGLALDPQLNERLAEAVEYWDRQGITGLVVSPTEVSCDVPVRPGPVRNTAYAHAYITWLTDENDCTPQHVELNADKWDKVIQRGITVRILAHEIGHLYCLPDSDNGVMGLKKELPGFDDAVMLVDAGLTAE